MDPSYVWVDGEWTDEEIDGTCAVGLSPWGYDSLDELKEDAIKRLNRLNGFYPFDHVYLIGGYSSHSGEDDGEIVIKDAEVVGILQLVYHGDVDQGNKNDLTLRQEKGGEKENRDNEEEFIDTFLREKLPEDKRAIVEAKVNASIEANLEGMTSDNVTDIRDAMPILEGLRTTYFNEGHLRLTEDDVEAAKDRAALWYGYARRCFDNDERTRRLLGRHAVGGRQGGIHRGGEKVSAGNADRGIREDGRRGVLVRENAEYREIMTRFKRILQEAKKHSENQGAFSHGLLEQSAWHGSPHVFDYFDLGAIGTGEGAQAHGWGLYFAKEREVGVGYVLSAKG
ncbi:MAG: hypothetical protein ACTTH3_06840 [Schwartzia sp. (in: firmicutes)]